MTQRIATYALAAAALLMPLIWSSAFSDFDGMKWVLLLAVATCCLPAILVSTGKNSGTKNDYFLSVPGILILTVISPQFILYYVVWMGISVLRKKERLRPILSGLVTLSVFLTLTIGLMQENNLLGSWLPYQEGSFSLTLGNAGHVAEFAVAALPLIWAFCGRRRWYWVAAYSLPAVALVIRSDSRAGLLAMALSVVVSVLLTRRQPKTPLQAATPLWRAGAAAGVVIAGLALLGAPEGSTPQPLERLGTVVDSSHPTNQVRVELWKEAWGIFRESPLTGSQQSFEENYSTTRSPKEWDLSGFDSIVTHPHNEFLHLLSTFGILGGLILLAFTAWAIIACRAVWRNGDQGDRAQLIVASTQWSGIVTMALFWAPIAQPTIGFLLLVSMGLAFRPEAIPQAEGPTKKTATGHRILILALLIAFAIGKPDELPESLWRDAQFVSQRDALEVAKRDWAISPSSETMDLLREESESTMQMLMSGPSLPARSSYRLLLALTDIRRTMIALNTTQGSPTEERLDFLAVVSARSLRGAFIHACTDGHINSFLLRAQFETTEGRNIEATEVLEEVLELNPSTPRARIRLAAMAADAGLPDRAMALLAQELALYGDSQRSDSTWEQLARTTGWARRIEDANTVVEDWIRALGPSIHRQAVGGAISLHIGETPQSIGTFLRDPEPFAERAERANLFAASLSGLPPMERHARCLAHLFKHPHDGAVLDALGDAISMRISDAAGETAQLLRAERYRALARAKIIHAWDDHEDGEDARAMVFLRLAAKANDKNREVFLIRTIIYLDEGDDDKALQTLHAWHSAGGSGFDALDAHPLTRSFRRTPAARTVLDEWGK